MAKPSVAATTDVQLANDGASLQILHIPE